MVSGVQATFYSQIALLMAAGVLLPRSDHAGGKQLSDSSPTGTPTVHCKIFPIITFKVLGLTFSLTFKCGILVKTSQGWQTTVTADPFIPWKAVFVLTYAMSASLM